MDKFTFLAPFGATFSHLAYNALSEAFEGPHPILRNYTPSTSNEDVLRLMKQNSFLGRRCYGAIAMETSAKGRITQSLEPFIGLLSTYGDTESCPFHVVGAVKLGIDFCCMARKGIKLESATKVIAHQEALFTCRNWVGQMLPEATSEMVSSNGEAARRVAEEVGYETSVALGPQCAADMYGLEVLTQSCQDTEAKTTFFLLAPYTHAAIMGENNRALVMFELPHKPGALAKALTLFADQALNLIQIHSTHIGNQNYHFVIELDIRRGEEDSFSRAMRSFRRCVKRHIVFGPFEVVSR
ncbi:MAG: prephenate dehydratase domain-containing protein [Patescibacteria group bacterium]